MDISYDDRVAAMDARADSLHALDQEELDSRLVSVEERLYWARHDNSSDESRERLEIEWNAIQAERTRREGSEWTYKVDRRDDFVLEVKHTRGPEGEYREVTVDYTAHDSSRTINWRETRIGAKRDQDIRKQFRGEMDQRYADHGSHIAGLQHGADPEGVNKGAVDPRNPDALPVHERLNITAQNDKMNQGIQNRQDNALKRKAEELGQPLQVKATSRQRITKQPDGSTTLREVYRKFDHPKDPANEPHPLRLRAGKSQTQKQPARERSEKVKFIDDHPRWGQKSTLGKPGTNGQLYQMNVPREKPPSRSR